MIKSYDAMRTAWDQTESLPSEDKDRYSASLLEVNCLLCYMRIHPWFPRETGVKLRPVAWNTFWSSTASQPQEKSVPKISRWEDVSVSNVYSAWSCWRTVHVSIADRASGSEHPVSFWAEGKFDTAAIWSSLIKITLTGWRYNLIARLLWCREQRSLSFKVMTPCCRLFGKIECVLRIRVLIAHTHRPWPCEQGVPEG